MSASPTRPFDVESIRADFPILANEVYGKPLVYLDSAASAQKPRQVVDRMVHAYEHEYANVHRGLHYLANAATEAFEEARRIVDVVPFAVNQEVFAHLSDSIYDLICSDPRTARYKELVKRQLDENKNFESFFDMEAVEPWITLSHGDYWVNNILFKHGT